MSFRIDSKIQPKQQGIIFSLYIVLVMAVYILPALKLTVPYILAAALMLLFLPIVLLKMKSVFAYLLLLLGTSACVLFVSLLTGIYGTVDAINEFIRNLRFFLPAVFAVFAFRFCDSKRRNVILTAFAVMTGYMLLKTFDALQKDMWITRILAQDKATDTALIRSYRMANVGGFEFSYMIGIIILGLLWAFFHCKNKIVKILCVVGVVIGYYYIIQTMYTTLLILISVGIMLMLILCVKNIIAKVALAVVGIVLIFSLAPLFKYLSGVFSGSLLSVKFMRIYNALMFGDVDALGSRPELIMEAVTNWAKSPIIGGYEVSERTHSLFFSILESTGLIGAVSYIGCFIASYKMIVRELKLRNVDTLLVTLSFLYVFTLSVLNPVGYVFEVTVAAFFIIPLWSSLICKDSHTDRII